MDPSMHDQQCYVNTTKAPIHQLPWLEAWDASLDAKDINAICVVVNCNLWTLSWPECC